MCMPYFTDRGMTRWSLSPVWDNFMGVVSETEYMRKLTIFFGSPELWYRLRDDRYIFRRTGTLKAHVQNVIWYVQAIFGSH